MIVTMVPAMLTSAGAEDALMAINLKAADWVDETKNAFSFSRVEVEGTGLASSVTVSVDKGKISSAPETASDVGYKIIDNNNRTLVYVFLQPQTAAEVTAWVKDIQFEYAEGMKISVTADMNENEGFDNLPEGTKATYNPANGHYYMYVPYDTPAVTDEQSWGAAVNNARTFKLGGRQGYLSTITTQNEFEFVRALSSYSVWLGATALRMKDTEEQIDAAEGEVNRDDLMLPANHTDYNNPGYQPQDHMYWVDGPEKGQYMNSDNVEGACWKQREPNAHQASYTGINLAESCLMIYVDGGLNDIFYDNLYVNGDPNGIIHGYIVEFGYDSDDPGGRDEKDADVREVQLGVNQADLVWKTGHMFTFTGVPGLDYEVTDAEGNKYPIEEIEDGVFRMVGLDKDTDYTIDGGVFYGQMTVHTDIVDAEDIAKNYDTAADGSNTTTNVKPKTDDDNHRDETEAASNDRVTVTVTDDGHYKITFKDEIPDNVLPTPGTWGDTQIEIDLDNNASGDKFGSLDSTTNTVTVKDAKPGLTYTIYDENGNKKGEATANDDGEVTFEGLDPDTTYTVKTKDKENGGDTTITLGDIKTKPTSSGGHHSSSSSSSVNFVIKASAGTGGSISPSGSVSVAKGANKAFTISADDGYEISDVLVDGVSVGTKDSYTFTNVSASHTIEVKFRKTNPQIVTDPSITGVANWLETDDHVVYLHGYPDHSFRPENQMTRAEVAQMFYNLLLDQDVETTVKFTDVADSAWYAEAVNALASIGVIKGVGHDQFAPDRSITRAEFGAIATRFAKQDDSGVVNFTDIKTSDWFYGSVRTAVSYGWLNGYTDGSFRPLNTITRTEVTAIVNRMLARAGDTAYAHDHGDVMKHFTDVSDSFWGYADIIEATNKHDYTKADGVENWQ